MDDVKKPAANVISLSQKRHARAVLHAFDRLKHDEKRSEEEKRAETERKARNQF